MVVEKYAPGNPAWHFKMWFLSTSGTPEFFSKVTSFWSLISLHSRIRWAKLMNRINYFQVKCQLTCIKLTKNIFSVSLFRGCKLCFRSKDFSAWRGGKESRTFKPREPLKAILKIVFLLQGSAELNELSGLGRQSCWLLQPVQSVVTLELIHLHVASQSSISTRCANGAALPAWLISTYILKYLPAKLPLYT